MRENELGSLLSKELRKQGVTVFKLHNDGMQRGLPDFLVWGHGGKILTFELKVARSLVAAADSLSPGQESVLRSLAHTQVGAIIAYGGDCNLKYVVGVGRFFFRDCADGTNLIDMSHEKSEQFASTKAEAARLLAAEIKNIVDTF